MQNQQKGSSNVVLVVVFTILVLLVAYILVYKRAPKASNEELVVENTDQKVNPAPSVDATASWKTYKNTEYGYEFKYPQDKTFEEHKTPDDYYNTDKFQVNIDTKSNIDSRCEGCDGPAIFFSVAHIKPKNDLVSNCESDLAWENSKIIVGGVSGDKCLVDLLHGNTLNVYVTNDGHNYYVISANDYVGERIQLIDKILSTFKFTNNVGTYIYYSKHGFSIELPKGFTPTEYQAEGGPAVQISLPVGGLAYVTNPAFWEKNNIPSYTYVKEEKFGNNIFKIYLSGKEPVYWLKQGNIGYEFGALETDKVRLESLLKTFKLIVQ